MIIHVKLILFVIFTIEILKRFHLFSKLKDIKVYSLKLFNLINLKKVSDNWKEKVLFKYCQNIFVISLKIFLILIIILFFYIFLIHLNELMQSYFFSIYGFLEISIIGFIYYKLRNFKNG